MEVLRSVVHLCFHLFPFVEGAVCNVYEDAFVHSFPEIVLFDEVISPVDALVTHFIMNFDEYCEMS